MASNISVVGVIVSAVSRKIAAVVAEIRVLVNKAKVTEQAIIAKAKSEINTLKNELVNDISKL